MPTLSKQQQRKLHKLLPAHGKDEQILLPAPFWKALSDTDFIIIWNMPDANILLPPRAEEYVEERRKKLGLKFTKNAGYNLHENGIEDAEVIEVKE